MAPADQSLAADDRAGSQCNLRLIMELEVAAAYRLLQFSGKFHPTSDRDVGMLIEPARLAQRSSPGLVQRHPSLADQRQGIVTTLAQRVSQSET